MLWMPPSPPHMPLSFAFSHPCVDAAHGSRPPAALRAGLAAFATVMLLPASGPAATFATANDEQFLRFHNPSGWGSGAASYVDGVTFPGWQVRWVTNLADPVANASIPPNFYTSAGAQQTGYSFYLFRSPVGDPHGSLGTRNYDAHTGAHTIGGTFLGTRLVNASGAPISSISLGYTAEQWAVRAGDAGTFVVAVSVDADSPVSGTWQDVDALHYSSPRSQFTGSSFATDGRALPENRTVFRPVNVALPAPVPPGGEVWIRWFSVNAPGVDQSIAIDEIRVTANPVPQFNAVLTVGTDPDPLGLGWDHTDRAVQIGDGPGAAGSVTVPAGTSLPFYDIYLGVNDSTASGTLELRGAGATAESSRATGFGSRLHVGEDGIGELIVADGAVLTRRAMAIGVQPGSSGTVTVTGVGSRIMAPEEDPEPWDLVVGLGGSGALNVLDSGVVEGIRNLIAGGPGGNAEIVAYGESPGFLPAFSRISVSGDAFLAADTEREPTGGTVHVRLHGLGTLSIGSLSVGGDLIMRRGATIKIEPAGSLDVDGQLDFGPHPDPGMISIEGGSFHSSGILDLSIPSIAFTSGVLSSSGLIHGLSTLQDGYNIRLNGGVIDASGSGLVIESGAALAGSGIILGDVHVSAGGTLGSSRAHELLIVIGNITGPGSIQNATSEIRPATVDRNGVVVSPFGTLTFNASLDLTAILRDATTPLFMLDLGDLEASDRIHFDGAELRVGTNGLDLDNFSFTTHPGFTDGVYTLIGSTEWLGGSLGPSRRGTVDGKPVWLRVGNDAKTIELRVGSAASEHPYEFGQSYFGRNQYVEYQPGNIPLVLVSPHDGGLQPGEIPPRTWGTTARDLNLHLLTLAAADEIMNRTGRRPHVVLSHLHRTRLDPNRAILEAAQENIHAEQTWSEYHETFIPDAMDAAIADAGFAFLIDMHGHSHPIARLELDFLLGPTELNRDDDTLNLPGYIWQSGLRQAALRNPETPFSQLIRGQSSLGTLYNDHGVPAWPSAQFPVIGDNPFFNNGFTPRTHAGRERNRPTAAMMIEHHRAVRMEAPARAEYAAAFAGVIQRFMAQWFGYSIGSIAQHQLSANTTTTFRGGPPVALILTRTGYLGASSVVHVEFSGTATKGSDYSVDREFVAFPAGASTAAVILSPAAVGPATGDRTMHVQLVPDSFTSVEPTVVELTLGDGTSQTVRVHATAPLVSSAERSAVFRLLRTSSAGPLTVPLLWEGTAIAGGHFEAPAVAWFADGVAEVEVVCHLRDAGIHDDDRTITLRPQPASPAVTGHPSAATTVLSSAVRPRGLALWLGGDLADNTWRDQSGFARHAVALPAGAGPQPASSSGHPAIRFDGSSATATVPRFVADPEGAFSIAFHFRLNPGATTNAQNILSFGERGSPGSIAIYLTSSTNMRTWLGHATASTAAALSVSRTWTDGQWRHYALTVSPDGVARVFIDGELAAQSASWQPPLQPDQVFWIGWNPARRDARGFFEGDLRDFRVYQNVLTEAEIRSLAEGRLTLQAWKDQFNLDTSQSPWDADSLPRAYVFAALPSGITEAHGLDLRGDLSGFTFQRQPGASDLHYRIEGNFTLQPGTWQLLAELPPGTDSWLLHGSGFQISDRHGRIDFQDNRPILPDEAQRFLRLRVDVN